jgi:hypothetical protein
MILPQPDDEEEGGGKQEKKKPSIDCSLVCGVRSVQVRKSKMSLKSLSAPPKEVF